MKKRKLVKILTVLSVVSGTTAPFLITSCSQPENYRVERLKYQTTINNKLDHFEKIISTKAIDESDHKNYSIQIKSLDETISFDCEIEWTMTFNEFYVNLNSTYSGTEPLKSKLVNLTQSIVFNEKIVNQKDASITINPEPPLIPSGRISDIASEYAMIVGESKQLGYFTTKNIADISKVKVKFIDFEGAEITDLKLDINNGLIKTISQDTPCCVQGRLVLNYESIELDSTSYFSINVNPKERISIQIDQKEFNFIEDVSTNIGSFQEESIEDRSKIIWRATDTQHEEIDYLQVTTSSDNKLLFNSQKEIKNVEAKVDAFILIEKQEYLIGRSQYFTFSCRTIKPQVEVKFNEDIKQIRKSIRTVLATYESFNITTPDLFKSEPTFHNDQENWKIEDDKNGTIYITALEKSTQASFDFKFLYDDKKIWLIENFEIASRDPKIKIDVNFDEQISHVTAFVEQRIGEINFTDVDDVSHVGLKFFLAATLDELKWEWKIVEVTQNTYSLRVFFIPPLGTINFFCESYYQNEFKSKTAPKQLEIKDDYSPKITIDQKSYNFEANKSRIFSEVKTSNVDIKEILFEILDINDEKIPWEIKTESSKLYLKPTNIDFVDETFTKLVKISAMYKENNIYKSPSPISIKIYKPDLFPQIIDEHFLKHCDIPVGMTNSEMSFSIKNLPSADDGKNKFYGAFIPNDGVSVKSISVELNKIIRPEDDKNTTFITIIISSEFDIAPNTLGTIDLYFNDSILGSTPELSISTYDVGFVHSTGEKLVPGKQSKIFQLHEHQIWNEFYKLRIRISFYSTFSVEIKTWKYQIGTPIFDKQTDKLVSFDIFITPPLKPTDADKEVLLLFEVNIEDDVWTKICMIESPLIII